MSPESVITLGIQALKLAASLAGPLLLAALMTGLIISLLQAATQLNEMTLSFIPKILAVAITLLLVGPRMLSLMVDYIKLLFSSLPTIIL